jgi:hypothetical protein
MKKIIETPRIIKNIGLIPPVKYVNPKATGVATKIIMLKIPKKTFLKRGEVFSNLETSSVLIKSSIFLKTLSSFNHMLNQCMCVSPFIVIPCQNLDQVSTNNTCHF